MADKSSSAMLITEVKTPETQIKDIQKVFPYEKEVYSSVLLVYSTSFKLKIGKYTFSLLFMYFSEMGFMYFSGIYLKLHLSILDLYFEKV